MRKILGAAALLALGACASGLSEEQCLSGDPASFGFEDGRDGYAVTRVEDRVAQCTRYELNFDRAAYARGWERGNRIFCTPEGALETALNGKGDIRNCLQADLLTRDAFEIGRNSADAKSKYDSAQSRYDSLISTIRNERYTIEKSRRQLVNERDEDARNRLYKRIEEARRDLRRAEDDLYYAEREMRDADRYLDRMEYELSRIRAQIRSRAYDDERRGEE